MQIFCGHIFQQSMYLSPIPLHHVAVLIIAVLQSLMGAVATHGCGSPLENCRSHVCWSGTPALCKFFPENPRRVVYSSLHANAFKENKKKLSFRFQELWRTSSSLRTTSDPIYTASLDFRPLLFRRSYMFWDGQHLGLALRRNKPSGHHTKAKKKKRQPAMDPRLCMCTCSWRHPCWRKIWGLGNFAWRYMDENSNEWLNRCDGTCNLCPAHNAPPSCMLRLFIFFSLCLVRYGSCCDPMKYVINCPWCADPARTCCVWCCTREVVIGQWNPVRNCSCARAFDRSCYCAELTILWSFWQLRGRKGTWEMLSSKWRFSNAE